MSGRNISARRPGLTTHGQHRVGDYSLGWTVNRSWQRPPSRALTTTHGRNSGFDQVHAHQTARARP